MVDRNLPGWHIFPGYHRLGVYLKQAVLLDILFVVVYGGINWLTTQRSKLFDLYSGWELVIPFVPAMIYVYFSIIILFILPLFCLNELQMKILAKRIALAILLSGLVFLLLPARLGFSRPQQVIGYETIYSIMYAVDPPHNLFPSLHIAYSALIIDSLLAHSPLWLRWFWSIWLALIGISVVLVHQHHIADVAGGLLITWISRKIVKDNTQSEAI